MDSLQPSHLPNKIRGHYCYTNQFCCDIHSCCSNIENKFHALTKFNMVNMSGSPYQVADLMYLRRQSTTLLATLHRFYSTNVPHKRSHRSYTTDATTQPSRSSQPRITNCGSQLPIYHTRIRGCTVTYTYHAVTE